MAEMADARKNEVLLRPKKNFFLFFCFQSETKKKNRKKREKKKKKEKKKSFHDESKAIKKTKSRKVWLGYLCIWYVARMLDPMHLIPHLFHGVHQRPDIPRHVVQEECFGPRHDDIAPQMR
jgi:hypothetical protein